jgi:hypothetical protein
MTPTFYRSTSGLRLTEHVAVEDLRVSTHCGRP